MITDIFARRYADVQLRPQFFLEDHRFMVQAAAIIGNPLWVGHSGEETANVTEDRLKQIHGTIALELGRERLSDQFWWNTATWNGNTNKSAHKYTYTEMVRNFLKEIPKDTTTGDAWVKDRLSLIELAFRRRGEEIAEVNRLLPTQLLTADLPDWDAPARGIRVLGKKSDGLKAMNARVNSAFDESVADLNGRMRLAGYRLHYHNGFIQLSDDKLVEAEVARPFWALVTDPRFANVDLQLKEAIDRRDRGDRTSAFHAVCALESCIKIICEIKGWTKGTEKGAANYVDHLNSKANGRFIEPWEGKTLKEMFTDVRNPFAHGPGQEPMPTLNIEQTQWAIDTSMTWCKSLLTRLK